MLDILWVVLILELIAHLVMWYINTLKIDSDYPILFKMFYYFIIYNIEILIFVIYVYIMQMLKEEILISYVLIKGVLFFTHFALDEDFIFRFEKGINFLITYLIAILLYVLWYITIII